MTANNPHLTTASQVPDYGFLFGKPKTREEALRFATHEHYKGGLYRVICEATHTETGEKFVVREHVWPHESSIKVRPADLFYGTREDGTPRYRKLTKIIVRPYVPMAVDQGVGLLRDRVAIVETLEDVEKIDFIKSWLDAGSGELYVGLAGVEWMIGLYVVRPGYQQTGPGVAAINRVNELIAFIEYHDPSFTLTDKWPAVSFD
jgi:hypothetical protein